MRFVLVDLDGASRDYFDDRESLVDELRLIEENEPADLTELFVMTFDAAGDRIGEPARADDLLQGAKGVKTYRYEMPAVAAWSGAIARIIRRGGPAAPSDTPRVAGLV